MATSRKRGWSWATGEKGKNRVRVYDRGSRGIFLEWRGEHDKIGHEHLTPLVQAAKLALIRHRGRGSADGKESPWVFPARRILRSPCRAFGEGLVATCGGGRRNRSGAGAPLALAPLEVRHGAQGREPEGSVRPRRLEGSQHDPGVLPAAGSRHDARGPGEPGHAALGPRQLNEVASGTGTSSHAPRCEWRRKAPMTLRRLGTV